MTNKNLFNKISSKIIWVFTIISIICSFAFLFTACNNSNSNDDEPTYAYEETNDGLISNGWFGYGTTNLDFTSLSSLPRTSVTGWSKSTSSSDVNSGVIDVSKNGWITLIDKLYDDNDFITYAQKTFDFSKDDIRETLKEELSSEPTNSQIKEKIIKDYFTGEDGNTNYLPNPGTHADAKDNKIYMLNNYDKDDLGLGVYQNITSASTITLEKGSYGKFTVWVKTQNLRDYTNKNVNESEKGAFIAVNNKFNSTAQAQYRIQNIITSDWKQYTIYVKADEIYDTSVTLVLGLGENAHNIVEGTVYFDDVEFAHVDKSEYDASIIEDTQNLIYANTKNDVLTDGDKNIYLYDMTLSGYVSNNETGATSDISTFKKVESFNVEGSYTVSNNGVSKGDKFGTASMTPETNSGGEHPADNLNNIVINLNKASYTLTYKSSSLKVAPKSYVYVEFYVKNQLSKFGSTTITFDIFEDLENNGIKDSKYKSKAVTSLSEVSDEWTKVSLMINNNFPTGDRYFIIDVVIGPTDVATANTAPEYASGVVTITNPLIATALISQYDDDNKENINYRLYNLLNSNSNAKLALYAGMQQDFVEDSTSNTYSINYSTSDIGSITYRPATPVNYSGVGYNHVYVMNENDHSDLETNINDRVSGKDGSFAGLINTKYVDNYELANEIKSALQYNGKENIQPLMIYNKALDSYGYVGVEKSISSSSYAKISVDVRVVGDAVAYVYLVDVSGKVKDVVKFDTNNLVLDQAEELAIKVTSNMMDSNGWTTINFYIATGATNKNFRLELWNGDRDGQQKSSGYVFYDNINIALSNGFTEPSSVADAFTVSGNPLYDIGLSIEDSVVKYTRKLTDIEEQFNKEQTDSSKKISYKPSIIWAKNDTNIYAIYNTIDPVEVDPYLNEDDDVSTSGGCTNETDPATFWLSFSSILLGVVLVLAIIMLVIKNIRRRRKANESDAKSHFKVVSRSRIYKPSKEEVLDTIEEDDTTEFEEDIVEEPNAEGLEEQTDEYVYGEVEDFGDNE